MSVWECQGSSWVHIIWVARVGMAYWNSGCFSSSQVMFGLVDHSVWCSHLVGTKYILYLISVPLWIYGFENGVASYFKSNWQFWN